jgi:NitT/TauT family transport system ATP-binding protein
MVRWGQATIRPEAVKIAKAVFRPDLYDAALGRDGRATDVSDAIGAFAGPAFDPNDIAGHLAAFKIGRRKS